MGKWCYVTVRHVRWARWALSVLVCANITGYYGTKFAVENLNHKGVGQENRICIYQTLSWCIGTLLIWGRVAACIALDLRLPGGMWYSTGGYASLPRLMTCGNNAHVRVKHVHTSPCTPRFSVYWPWICIMSLLCGMKHFPGHWRYVKHHSLSPSMLGNARFTWYLHTPCITLHARPFFPNARAKHTLGTREKPLEYKGSRRIRGNPDLFQSHIILQAQRRSSTNWGPGVPLHILWCKQL